MNELSKRAIFGVLYVGIMLLAVLTREHTPAILLLVFSLLGFVGVLEYSALVGINRPTPLRRIFDALMAVYLIVSSSLGASLLPYVAYLLYVAVRSIYAREGQPEVLAKTLMGHVYVALPLAVAIGLKTQGVLLLGLVCIWANDTGAFIFGSLLGKSGKHKLFPSVSPKKSWEGFVGGGLVSIGLSLTLATLGVDGLHLSLPTAALYGLVVSVFATWGDLFESLLKRTAGVKDSGNILPGHGGVLDRIDSILFVMPALLLLELCLQSLGLN